MRGSAPADVAETLLWLEDTGWEPQATWGLLPDAPNMAVEFTRAGDGITIIRDRGQWMLHIHPERWNDRVDLSIVHDALAGRSEWSGPMLEKLPDQLPSGVAWREWLPRALTWLSEAPDRERTVRALQLQRIRDMFPVTRSRRRRDDSAARRS